ncbi:MAG: class I SAM-dependent methyltransferase [Rudaea sp.]
MTAFKDHFSGHAQAYRDARPTYPTALYAWLAQESPDRQLAWDVGCGNGQASVALAAHFARVIGTDPSANQIAGAQPQANVEYRVEPAERSSLADASASVVTVAQALHWFDFAPFYAEVRRVLRPGGMLAAWSYAACKVADPGVDRIIARLYDDLTGPFWPPERAYVDAGYRTLPFPFTPVAAPAFPMLVRWRVEQLLRYLRSWSATQRFITALGEDPVAIVEDDLREAWGDADRQRDVSWIFHLRAGRVDSTA